MSRDFIEPRVTDHAVLRYIERVLGFDVEAIRTRIMSKTVRDAIRARAGAVTVDGYRYELRAGAVVTIMPASADGTVRAPRRREPAEEMHA
jgi:Asp-tRNA(Asn)/Glu-tRNA(Gln) amidotransferase C subunit